MNRYSQMNEEQFNNEISEMTSKELDSLSELLNVKANIKGFWKMRVAEKRESLISEWKKIVQEEITIEEVSEEIEEVVTETVTEEPMKKNRKRKAIKIVFSDGTGKEYQSAAQAVKELNLKNSNCISGYWIKGKCLGAMRKNGIESINYVD